MLQFLLAFHCLLINHNSMPTTPVQGSIPSTPQTLFKLEWTISRERAIDLHHICEASFFNNPKFPDQGIYLRKSACQHSNALFCANNMHKCPKLLLWLHVIKCQLICECKLLLVMYLIYQPV